MRHGDPNGRDLDLNQLAVEQCGIPRRESWMCWIPLWFFANTEHVRKFGILSRTDQYEGKKE